MRFAIAAACTFALSLGALLGGITVSSGADAVDSAPRHSVASASVTDTVETWDDDHGNG